MRLTYDAHALRFRVSNVDGSITIHKDAVRPTQCALQRVSFRAVPTRAGPCDESDGSGERINHANCMVLRVSDVDVSFRTHRDALRSVECR